MQNPIATCLWTFSPPYLRELVAKGLEDLEDYYLAAATMERVRKGEEKVYSAEEIRKDLAGQGGVPSMRPDSVRTR